MRRRQRTAVALLALAAVVILGVATAGISLLVAPGDAPEAKARSSAIGPGAAKFHQKPVVPTTPANAAGLGQLLKGDALAHGEVLGIDVSAHQGTIDWAKVRGAGVSVAYIKATEGAGHEDSRFRANWEGAKKAGLARGAYHYYTLCTSPEEQATSFLATAPPDSSALPPALDLELDGACKDRPEKSRVDADVQTFVSLVEKAWGRKLVIYSSGPWRAVYSVPVDGRPSWTTQHDSRPGGDWAIWQVRFTARIPGITGKVDLDVVRPEALGAAG